MKKLLLITLLSAAFLSCHPPKTVTEVSVPQTNFNKNTTLSGKWTLVNYSAFMHLEEGESMPKYAPGDVVWDFGKGNGRGGLTVTKRNPKEKNDFSMKPGAYRYWTRECLLKIDEGLFIFSFSNDELVVNSNSDPSMSADGAVLRFKRME